MERSAWRLIVLTVAVFAAMVATLPARDDRPTTPHAAAFGGTALVPHAGPPTRLPDPFPIRRVFMPADRWFDPPAVGGLLKISQDEFEERVQAAATAQEIARTPPTLVRAEYRATYSPGRVSGRLAWTIINPGGTPGVATLDPLKVAIGPPIWASGKEAILFRGKLARRNLPGNHLWVDGAGGELTADWSARGSKEPDEERFELAMPTVAISTLELTLPVDRVLVCGTRGAILTGPFPASTPADRVWKLAFGGLSSVALGIRPHDPVGASPLVSRTARYELTPGELRATFEFPGQSGGTESAFDVDPELRIVGVRGVSNDHWQCDPGKSPQAPGRLRVRGGWADTRIVVTTVAPLPTGLPSVPFPSVRPTRGSIGWDTLDVTLHPDLTLTGWDTGDYRVSVSGQQPDRTFRLQFVGSLASTSGERRKPPVVRLRSTEATYTTDEVLDWTVSPGRTRLSARLKVKVLRGPLAVLVVRGEQEYVLDAVTLTPGDTAVAFSAQPGVPGGWVVEPTRAIPTGQTVELRLDFHGPSAVRAADPADPSPAGTPIAFPTFALARATDRNGVLNVTGDGQRTAARTSAMVLPVGPTAFVVPYRGRLPDGDARFTPERAIAVLNGIDVTTVDGVWSVILTGATDNTTLGTLTLFVPGDTANVKVPGASVRRVSPVEWFSLFADPNGWSLIGAAATSMVAPGTLWQITFERPIRGEFSVTINYPLRPDTTTRPTIPFPTLAGVNPIATKVILSPNLAAMYRPADADRLLRGLRAFPAKLELVHKVATATPSRAWQIADVRVTTLVAADDPVVILTGRVTEANGGTLPIGLPPRATVETAAVCGKWTAVRQSGIGLDLPLPELPIGGAAFEVRYRLPKPDGWLFPRYHSPLPELPASPPVTSHWTFGDGYQPWPTLDPSAPLDAESVRAVPVSLLLASGLLLAGAVLAVGVRVIVRRDPTDMTILAGILFLVGLVAWLSPGGWWVVVRPSLVAGFVLWAVAVTARMRTRAIAPVAVGLLVPPLFAQPDDPPAVFVVNANGGRFAVYAPQAVVDKLAEWSASPMPDVVVTRSDYTGSAGDGVATFDARFTLVSTRDGPHTLSLPLTGVRLERATVDGTEAFPDAAHPDRYLIPVTGKGKHELTLRFAVIPVATVSSREVRFTGPEVPVSRIIFTVRSTGVAPDVVSRRGGQVSRAEANGTTVTADHGSDRTVTVRWREATVANATGVAASVREAGVWDVSETTPAVTTAIAFSVRNGLTDRFTFDLPAGLQAVRVTARGADVIGVRSWTVGAEANGWSPVEVRLTQPTDELVTVVVRAVPTKPLTAAPVLRFPRATGVSDADRDSVYGVRFAGVQATGMTMAGAIDYPADALVKDFPTVPEFSFDRSPPTRVVRRTPTAEAELRPALVPVSGTTPAGSEVVFTLGRWVEAEGAFRATGKEVGHLEFDIPEGCDLRDVRANGLAGWTRIGARVQVWLTQPTTDLTVRWNGAVPRNGDTVPLPLPRWPGRVTPTEPLTVRLRPTPGWTVTPRQMTGMQPRAGGTASELVFAAEPNATATVALTPVPVSQPRPVDSTSKPPTPPANEPAAAKPTDEAAPPSDTASGSSERWYWARAAVWLVGLSVTLALWVVAGSRWSLECLTGVGLLGASLFGLTNPIGWTFAAAAVAGLGGRVVRLIRGRVAG